MSSSRRDFGVLCLLWAVLLCPIARAQWDDLKLRAGDPGDPLAALQSWEGRDVYCYRSMLSPGILLRMKANWIRFFSDLDRYRAEAPSFFMIKTAAGAKCMSRGRSVTGQEMSASWIVCSFQGCRGWEQFDAPWFIALEKRPAKVTLTPDGLEIEFRENDTGHIFSMPLYGYYKVPQAENDFARRFGLPSQGIQPWSWGTRVPQEVTARCDWWAATSRAYPVGFQETFSVNPATDEIVFRQDYRWLPLNDDWGTHPRRFAVLSPSLALAWWCKGFPITVNAPVRDADYFTAFGPYAGCIDVDQVEVIMKVLQYVDELETPVLQSPSSQEQKQALDLIAGGVVQKFPDAWRYVYDHGSRENFCWNILGDAWYPRALPYVNESLRGKARSSLRIYMENDVLKPHFPFHGKYILPGPGIGSWGEWGDAGKVMTSALQPVWAYGQYAQNWDLIRANWNLIKKFFITPEEAGWIAYGRKAIAEIGDEAAPCSAYARMAWAVGDPDEYLFGSYMFARELVHAFVKQRGGRYFYERQPYNQYVPMPERIYPTDLWGTTRGWQVDGPIWGHLDSGEHQSANRWFHFHDPDVGRFYRDTLKEDVREELDWYAEAGRSGRKDMYRLEQYQRWFKVDNPHGMPGLARLRSLLLDAPFSALTGPEGVEGLRCGWGAADIAVGYSLYRRLAPVKYTRLVPRQTTASPFVPGLQRRGPQDSLTTVQEIDDVGLTIEPRWEGWDMPRNPGDARGGGRRSFGRVRGSFPGRVMGLQGTRWLSYGCAVHWADSIVPRAVVNPQSVLAAQDSSAVMFIGPFPNPQDDELTSRSYPPEREADMNASYPGPGGPVRWRVVRLNPGRHLQNASLFSAGDWSDEGCIGYILQYVWSPSDTGAYLLAGHQGGLVAWINDEKVISHHGYHRASADDAVKGFAHLKKGWNRILLKFEFFRDGSHVQFRLVHPDRQPIAGLRFAASPG